MIGTARLSSLLLASAVLLSSVASADRDRAKEEYREAVRRYDLNEFQTALEHFKKAYLEFEEPTFLFNIAQCYRQLGNKPQAILFYRSYLRKLPEASNAAEVRQLIATMEGEHKREEPAHESVKPSSPPVALAPSQAAVAPSPQPAATLVQEPIAKSAPTPVYKKWWLWALVGAAVAAGATTGIVLGVRGATPSETAFMTVRASP